MADPQDRAEALDDDRIGTDYPPDELQGADEYGITPAEERFDEPLEERLWREEPEEQPPDRPLVQPRSEEGESVLDVEKDLVAEAEETDPGRPQDPFGEVGERDATANERVPPAAEEAALRVEEG